jgi:hypothetical protein
MDEQLAALARWVESGRQEADVFLRVLISGGGLQGVIRPSSAFADMTEPVWVEHISKEMHTGWSRKPKADTRERAGTIVKDTLRPLRETPTRRSQLP